MGSKIKNTKNIEGIKGIKEIKDIETFKACLENESNYIIITDISNPMKIHKVTCSYIKLEHFQEKVIEHECKNGRYYCSTSLEDTLNELNKEDVDIEDLKYKKCLGND